MDTTSVAAPREETGTGVSRAKFRRRRNHAILLDTAWAKLLGVRKTAGVYQIRANELQLKLFLLQQASGLQRSDADRPGVNNDDDRRSDTLLKPLNCVTATGRAGHVKPTDRHPPDLADRATVPRMRNGVAP